MTNTTKYITIFFLLSLIGCYSFTGGSVPSHLKTISIPIFDDRSGFGEPGLRENFTNRTIERFRKDNSLELTDERTSDSILECTIITVRDEPSVVEAGEAVSKRKITITIKAVFQDMKMKRAIFDKQLSNWGEYEPGGGYEQRQSAINNAIEKLTEDILLETVSGW